MRWSVAGVALVVVMLAAGCLSFKFGREFPSPEPKMIVAGKTDKATLERVFGEPFQVGLDSGDQTWRWFYGQRNTDTELSKDFAVRFNPDGTVKSYSFSSNFPDDMKLFK
jgi:hypothetical protein